MKKNHSVVLELTCWSCGEESSIKSKGGCFSCPHCRTFLGGFDDKGNFEESKYATKPARQSETQSLNQEEKTMKNELSDLRIESTFTYQEQFVVRGTDPAGKKVYVASFLHECDAKEWIKAYTLRHTDR